jgi:hypothetical protein
MLQAFFVTLVKQGRLWELEHGRVPQDDVAAQVLSLDAHRRRAA